MSEVFYRPLIEDMTFSYSRLTSFSDCPYKWYMHYVLDEEEQDMFYASYGSFIHKLIEGFYRGEIRQEDLKMEFLLGFSGEVRGERPSQDIVSGYIEKGVRYFENFTPFPYDMIAVEKKINFKVGEQNFIGYIDFLGEKDGELYIVDNKSRELKPRSKRKTPTVNDKTIDEMLKQLYLYSLEIKEEYGRYPKALCFNCFKSGTFIEEEFKEDELKRTVEWAEKTLNSLLDTTEFYPNLEFFRCKYLCGLNDRCVFYETNKSYNRSVANEH